MLEPILEPELQLESCQVSEAMVLLESGIMAEAKPSQKTHPMPETILHPEIQHLGLSVTRQAELLEVSRTGAYQALHEEKFVDSKTISLMHRIDASTLPIRIMEADAWWRPYSEKAL